MWRVNVSIVPFLPKDKDGGRGAQNLPVTNLKGLVSRSPSDIVAIVVQGLSRKE